MPVLIKRYSNRKLYDTRSKRYITLEEIGELIRDEQEVKVIDNRTGNDITSVTLSQIIFEIEKNQAGFLPLKLLHSLVLSGGNRIEEMRQNIFDALSLFHHYDVEIERRIEYLVEQGELSQAEGSLLMGKLLAAGDQLQQSRDIEEGKILRYIWTRQIPSQKDIKGLIRKIDQLSHRVDELNSAQGERSAIDEARS